MADKQIRFNVEGADRVTKAYEDIRRKQEEVTNLGRKSSKEDVSDINNKIKALKELHRQQEENYRREINSRQLSSQQDAIAIREYQLERSEQSRTLSGSKRRKFDENTRSTVEEYQRNDIRERQGIINLRREAQEQKDNNKKQIDELRNVSDTIRGEGTKSRRDNSEILSRVSSTGMNLMGGNVGNILGGLLRFAGPIAAVGMIASMATNMTQEGQNSMAPLSTMTKLPINYIMKNIGNLRNSQLGMSPEDTANKMMSFTPSYGKEIGLSAIWSLAGSQLSRGFSDQQIQQLLSIQRYTGFSSFKTMEALENFSVKRGDKNLIMLPELMNQYLKSANEILNRTGRVDPVALQQSIMSISSSYGVSGLQADRMTSGILNVSRDQGGGIMRAMKMETLRKLYPGMSSWDMMGIMEDPSRDPKYQQALMNRISKFGGGGDWTKFFLMNQGFSWGEVEKLTQNKYQIQEYKSSGEKSIQTKYYEGGKEFVGSINKLSTDIGVIKDFIVSNLSGAFDGLQDLLIPGSKLDQSIERSVEKGTSKALKNTRP